MSSSSRPFDYAQGAVFALDGLFLGSPLGDGQLPEDIQSLSNLAIAGGGGSLLLFPG